MTTTSTARAARMTSPRNLINAGVFTALYFIALFGTGMLGIFHPAMMFAGWLLGIVVCAIICMLYIARTRAFGAYTVMGLVIGVLMVATGHAWITPLISTPLGLAADAVTRSGGYTRTAANALGFSIFSMWIIGPLLPIVWASDAYFADISRSMGQEYADGYRSLVTVPVIAGWAVVVAVISYGCALLGMRVLHKHFERAGVA